MMYFTNAENDILNDICASQLDMYRSDLVDSVHDSLESNDYQYVHEMAHLVFKMTNIYNNIKDANESFTLDDYNFLIPILEFYIEMSMGNLSIEAGDSLTSMYLAAAVLAKIKLTIEYNS